jgi:selenide,water dikinase
LSAPRDLLVVFGTVQRVMQAERIAKERGLDVDLIPAPRSVSSECGVVLELRQPEASALAELLAEVGLTPRGVYRASGGSWLPSSLEAASAPSAKLTPAGRYGGCGAKLAKGPLAALLCGLPRLESDDLLVGIEWADDAGVVRVRPDLAIIHTVDFFPPIVDDPFTFGRIAAANALSDVYAMGGTPLAGMNLVSFPSRSLEIASLREVLRGGLDALAEAGALLAGGHTIEGEELLYGLAVTGTVHPDRIWRNGGAQPGDLLVLTKPLGVGVITTAARADLARPGELATAIRWMSTLNRDAAAAAASEAPHAVTDVTGFALAGHAAEMAAASGVGIVLWLDELPLLPGAYRSASEGLVPAGVAKNRNSLVGALEVAADVDPIRVDLALDPQTSGGLLVACPPEGAARLVRQLPGGALVGRVESGPAGRIRLVSRRG